MNIPRCKEHHTTRPYVVPGSDDCEAEQRVLLLIAQNGNRAPRTLRQKSRAFHAAGGGTLRFDIAKYDRLMR